jgi:hypothetical protein
VQAFMTQVAPGDDPLASDTAGQPGDMDGVEEQLGPEHVAPQATSLVPVPTVEPDSPAFAVVASLVVQQLTFLRQGVPSMFAPHCKVLGPMVGAVPELVGFLQDIRQMNDEQFQEACRFYAQDYSEHLLPAREQWLTQPRTIWLQHMPCEMAISLRLQQFVLSIWHMMYLSNLCETTEGPASAYELVRCNLVKLWYSEPAQQQPCFATHLADTVAAANMADVDNPSSNAYYLHRSGQDPGLVVRKSTAHAARHAALKGWTGDYIARSLQACRPDGQLPLPPVKLKSLAADLAELPSPLSGDDIPRPVPTLLPAGSSWCSHMAEAIGRPDLATLVPLEPPSPPASQPQGPPRPSRWSSADDRPPRESPYQRQYGGNGVRHAPY